MRRFVTNMLFALGITVTAMLGLALQSALVLLQWPTLVCNIHALETLRPFLAQRGIGVTWRTAMIRAESHGIMHNTLTVSFTDLCVTTAAVERACFQETHLAFTYRLMHFLPTLTAIGPVRCTEGEVIIAQQPFWKKHRTKQPNTHIAIPHFTVPRWFGRAAFFPVEIALRNVTLKRSGGDYHGHGTLTGTPTQSRQLATIELVGAIHTTGGKERVDVRATLTSPTHFAADDWRLDGMARAALAAGAGTIDFRLEKTAQETMSHHLTITARHGKRAGTLELIGTCSPHIVQTRLTMQGVRLDLTADFEKPFDGTVNAALQITRFADVVRTLDDTPFAVWAPFNALDGQLNAHVQGTIDRRNAIGRSSLAFQTRLASERQRLSIDLQGETTLHLPASGNSGSQLELDVLLSEIRLELPDFSNATMPRLLPDQRFQTRIALPRAAKPVSFPIRYSVHVHTPGDHPLALRSHIAPQPIPIVVDLHLADGQRSGTIRVQQFPVQLFRRTATVKHFDLTLHDPTAQSDIDGAVHVRYADYDIVIRVLGTVEKPRVVFESDPPLSEADILAVLIYGEPFGKLDEDQGLSISGISAALADRAFTLGTLYLFASTPIQRISYNPQTKLISAKLKLGKGASLQIGTTTTTREYQVGIKKRFGNGWMINTTVETPTENKETRGTAYIEWHKRY